MTVVVTDSVVVPGWWCSGEGCGDRRGEITIGRENEGASKSNTHRRRWRDALKTMRTAGAMMRFAVALGSR